MTHLPVPIPDHEDVYHLEPDESAARPGVAPARPVVRLPTTGLSAAELDHALALYKTWREKLKQFIRENLVEATYDDRHQPVGGDYYRFFKDGKPTGSFAPRIAGADKVRQFMGWVIVNRRTVRYTETAEFVSYTQAVDLVTHDGEIRGSGEGTANSAEKGFQNQDHKYKGKSGTDWRGASNDLIARASIRAIRNAVQEAAGLREIFNEILAQRAPKAATGSPSEHLFVPNTPQAGKYAGRPIADPEVPGLFLSKLLTWARASSTTERVQALEEELERRRETAEGAA